MIRVTCKDCGKVYDYSKDDFCPKCGGFNPPPAQAGTKLEAELLSRFNGGQRNQSRGPAPSRPQGGYRYQGGDLERVRGAQWKGLLIALAVVLATTAIIAGLQYAQEPGALSLWNAETQLVTHTADEPFEAGSFRVEIDDVRYLSLEEASPLYREGYGLLAVDVYITGGGEMEKTDPVGTVSLLLPDGSTASAETDVLQLNRLKDLSEYAVDLRYALWEDPLLGSFIFYLPEDARSATLCLEELVKAGGGVHVKARHLVELTVPEDAWS